MAVGMGVSYLVLLMAGFVGFPVGIPPGPEDPVMAKVAPEECIVYLSWSGTVAPAAKSTNATERLLAEPEVRQFASEVEKRVRAGLRRALEQSNPQLVPAMEFGADFVKHLLTRPTAAFLSSFEVASPDAPPMLRGALVLGLDDQAAEVRKAREAPGRDSRCACADRPDRRRHLVLPATGPPGTRVRVGLSREILHRRLEPGRGPGDRETHGRQSPEVAGRGAPALPVPRPASLAYVNVKAIMAIVAKVAGEKAGPVIRASGVGNIDSLATVTGLDNTGFVSRGLLRLEGQPEGLMKVWSGKPLSAKDLAPIPREVAYAIAMRLDPNQLWDAWMDVVRKVEPRAAEEMSEGLRRAEQEVGVNLRSDVLEPLGDVWCVYVPSGGGMIPTGVTAVARVDDAKQLAKTHDTLVSLFRRKLDAAEQSRRPAPQLKEMEFSGRKIYYLELPTAMPVTPSWCLTDKELVFSLTPQSVKAYLARGADFQPLTKLPEVARLFQGKEAPFLVAYQDTPQLFGVAYAMLGFVAGAAGSGLRERGFDFDVAMLPSAESIQKHLKPGVTSIRRTAAGIEWTTQQTLPGFNIGASAPVAVALLLPAVQSARQAARRAQSANNLKQIALAMHNYHDTYKNFPAAYSVGKDGKPLLSWRVHILPFIEQNELYKQFHLDEPWDSEHNKTLIAKMPMVYRSPAVPLEPGKTTYLTVRGERTIFPGGKPMGMQHITDGTSNTIMTVEANPQRAVIWTRPDDFEPDPQDPMKGLLGVWPGGFLVGMADGSVQFLPQTMDRKALGFLFDRADGNAVTIPNR